MKFSPKQRVKIALLERLIDAGETAIQWIDFFAANQTAELSNDVSEEEVGVIFDLTLALSVAAGKGQSRIHIDQLNKYTHCFVLSNLEQANVVLKGEQSKSDHDQSQKSLQLSLLNEVNDDAQSPIASGAINHQALIFSDSYLYLKKYWSLRNSVNSWLDTLVHSSFEVSDLSESVRANMADVLERINASNNPNKNPRKNKGDDDCVDGLALDRQAVATAQSLLSRVLLVSGGPGTGKTTTAAKILIAQLYARLFVEDHPQSNPLKVACIAPTGKAAQRLAESLRAQSESLVTKLNLVPEQAELIQQSLPIEGQTIHRYLSAQGIALDDMGRRQRLSENQRLFAQGDSNSAAPDIVLIDESSMIDAVLMRALLSSFGEQTRSIFLGDPYQLPAIEPGAVFGDWVERLSGRAYPEEQLSSLAELLRSPIEKLVELNTTTGSSTTGTEFLPLVQLTKSYRFGGLLGELATGIRQRHVDKIQQLLLGNEGDANREEFEYLPLGEDDLDIKLQQSIKWLYDDFFAQVKQGVEGHLDQQVAVLQKLFDKAQVLSSTRQGPLGTDALNAFIEGALVERLSGRGVKSVKDQQYYFGKPVILEQNYSHLDLFNGDIGFMVETTSGAHQLAFYRGDHHPALIVPPAKVPNFRSAFAITVHKSQGSEYDRVALLLPSYAEELISQALLYTGVTRTKSTLLLAAHQKQVLQCFDRGN